MKYATLKAVQAIVFLVTVVFWAIFGTLFWIALITRLLGTFVAVLLYAMFTGQNPTEIHAHLERVTDLWFRGFRNAYHAVYGGGTLENDIEIRNVRLASEIFWTAIFWFGVLVAAGKISIIFIEPPFFLIMTSVIISIGTFLAGLVVGEKMATNQPATREQIVRAMDEIAAGKD